MTVSHADTTVHTVRADRGLVLRAALVAGGLSGAPSTAVALATGQDVRAATRAAGDLLARPGAGERELLVAGVVAHALISVGWAAVLSAVLPRRRVVLAGAAAGLGIAALDLPLARRVAPAVAALPTGPQVADHLAFGLLVGLTLRRRRLSATRG